MFSLATVVALDWFGFPHFSMNWGFVALAPVLGANVFSLAFGRNMDAHASPESPPGSGAMARTMSGVGDVLSRRAGVNSSQRLCFDGLSCYEASLRMTIVACSIATALSVLATWRDRKRHRSMLYDADAGVTRRRDGSDANEGDTLLN